MEMPLGETHFVRCREVSTKMLSFIKRVWVGVDVGTHSSSSYWHVLMGCHGDCIIRPPQHSSQVVGRVPIEEWPLFTGFTSEPCVVVPEDPTWWLR